jgi:hypothetical protein
LGKDGGHQQIYPSEYDRVLTAPNANNAYSEASTLAMTLEGGAKSQASQGYYLTHSASNSTLNKKISRPLS